MAKLSIEAIEAKVLEIEQALRELRVSTVAKDYSCRICGHLDRLENLVSVKGYSLHPECIAGTAFDRRKTSRA